MKTPKNGLYLRTEDFEQWSEIMTECINAEEKIQTGTIKYSKISHLNAKQIK